MKKQYPERKKAWRKANKARVAGQASVRALKTKYNISAVKLLSMYEQQRGRCAICGLTEKYNQRLAVDHCHVSGEVRGLLCTDCNRLIGLAKDNPQILFKASEYVK